MKTKDELTKLAFKIAGLVDDLKSSEAAELLDDLYRDGMKSVAYLSMEETLSLRQKGTMALNGKESSFQTSATVP